MIPAGSSEMLEVMKSGGQHLFSGQHRSLTRESRNRMCTSSLMERFLQDVLRHHPSHGEENRSVQNEMLVNTASPAEVLPVDDHVSEEEAEEDTGARGETPSKGSEGSEELRATSSQSQECTKELSVRPSVIQKLEKGQQQPLEFDHKIGTGVRKCNPVDFGQASNIGNNLLRPPVICNAPASCPPASSDDRLVTAHTTKLPSATSLDLVSTCDPNKVDGYLEQPDRISRNPESSPHLEAPSVSYQKPKESNRKSLCMNSDKVVVHKDVKSHGKTLLPGFKFQECMGTEAPLRVESPSELAENSALNLNKTDMPSNKGILDDSIPKYHEESFNMDCTQEEKHTIFNKSAFVKQKCSVSPEMKFDCSSLQSASDQHQETDQEERNYESRDPEMNFSCSSSLCSLNDQLKVATKETHLSQEAPADLQYKNNPHYASEINSDCEAPPHLVANQSQVIVNEVSLQNAVRVSLVDQSYESSVSEMNFDSDASLQSADDYSQQPVQEIDLPQEVHIGLVDKNYGSSSSEVSADSSFPLESVVDLPPVAAPETSLGMKVHIDLVDKNYGSSCSETSFDCDGSLQSVVDSPQLTIRGRNLKGRRGRSKHKKCKPKRARAHLDCYVSPETVTDDPPRALEEINPLNEKNDDLMDVSCESPGPDVGLHTDDHLVADHSQAAAEEVKPPDADIDLENKNAQSSISNVSFDSQASLCQSANDRPPEALDDISLEELNVDVEVTSCACSSSELTFDSDPPLLSVNDQSQLDLERKEHIDLEDESCESSSSEITFDSDLSLCSVVDQPQVAVYEEETVDLENKSNESCVSEITFDSDIPLHSGNDPPEVAGKEVILQKEEYGHVGRKSDEPCGSEITSDYYAPLHAVTSSPEVTARKLNPQKEEQACLEDKENEPADSELASDYDTIFHSMTGHSGDPIKEINLEKKEHAYLENEGVSGTNLNSDTALQSVTHKPEGVVKEVWLQKEKCTEFHGKNAEFSGLVTNLDAGVPHDSVTEPQVAIEKISGKQKHVLENKNEKCSGSEIALDSDVPPHSMTEQPQLAENYVNLKDKNSKSVDCKITFDSEQLQEAIKKINQWKEEAILLKKKIDEHTGSKLIHDTAVSVHSVTGQPEVAIKQTSLENKGHVDLDIQSSSYGCSGVSKDSDFLVQSVANRPHITASEQEHVELEHKHDQCCDSEITVDSDDPLQSVTNQFQETIKEVSLWKDEEVDVNDKRGEAKGFGIVCDSDVLQTVAGQSEEGVKEVSLWKEHVDLENKIVQPGDPKINFGSDEPLQSVANKIQGANKEIHHLREEHVCLDNKGCEPSESEIIYVSDIPLQSVIRQPQTLEEEHANLADKSSDCYRPERSFDSIDSFQSVADQLQQSVKDINLWKEDRIYLEDKSYKLGDFEVSCDSDIPVQFVTDPSSVSVQEINLQKKDHHDLDNEDCKLCGSEVKCDSCVHLQSEVDQTHGSCREAHLQKEEHLDVEDKTSEPSDSEMVCDSDVPFQIVVNPSQGSVKETNLPKVVLVDLIPGDSDCEVISDSDIPFQLVTDPPSMTVKDISCVNAECVIEDKSCDSFGSEVGCSCEALSPSGTNQCKETFKIINRKKDYIILGDSSCQSCGSEIHLHDDTSNEFMTYQSQEPDKKMVKYIDPEDKSSEPSSPNGNFNLEHSSHPVTHRLQKTHKEVRKDLRNTNLKGKSCQSHVSSGDCGVSPESVIHQRADKKKLLKLKQTDLKSRSYEPCGSEMNFQHDPSLQSVTDQPQEAVNRRGILKKVSSDLKEKNHDSQLSSVFTVDAVRNLDKAQEVTGGHSDEPVLEALPHVPPSFVGKTWSQIMREDDIKINALVKEFREGRFHCYFDDDCETKKVVSNKKKKRVTWADLKQDTVSTQAQSDGDDTTGGISDTNDFSVALDEPCHPAAERPAAERPAAERPPKQKGHTSSQCQMVKGSHGTQARSTNYPSLKRKRVRQEEDLPKSKGLQGDRKTKKKVRIGTVELPATCTEDSKPGQPQALLCILSSLNVKMKDDECLHLSKLNQHGWDDGMRFMCKYQRDIFDYYEPLIKQIIVNPPLHTMVPELDRRNWVEISFNRSLLHTPDADGHDTHQSSALVPLATVPAECDKSPLFVDEPEVLNAQVIPKDSDSQLTLLNRGVAKISSKSVRSEFLESKKKIQQKMTASHMPGFPQKIHKPVILQQKNRNASEKQSIWIRTKPSDVIRKYLSKYSVFLRHKYQSRSAFLGLYLKESGVQRLKKVRRPALMPLTSAVLPVSAKASSTMTRPVLKPPMRAACSEVRRKKSANKARKRKGKPPPPTKPYELRSLSCLPRAERMMTRLSNRRRGRQSK
ncbi:DBF4-type zinc finger-containing protein 2 [Carlito syrichta]|uniref:DBF4-type zinc finger-containing protein 2 n=1 Tax=Carlito syrichta TaxID=1868482 RepID=A0A1U7U0H1_CARSF|nr:DBF4-type zinc finger-containing protein 2 [Carlito syrichta]